MLHSCVKACAPRIQWLHNPWLSLAFYLIPMHNAFNKKLYDRKMLIPKAQKKGKYE